tara:strand:+ start:2760 stop:3014 length:255 start_codon:yes stop_codon:yes gene_type:complete
MSMKPIKRAVATVGKYTDNNGQEKTRYQRVGTLMKRDDGSVCLKLDCVPIGPEFTGWVNFYDIEEKQQQQASAPAQDLDDEIPF